MTKALIQNNLRTNTTYRVTLSLADNPDATQSIIIETPKFPSRMSYYLTNSRISKDISKDIETKAGVVYPSYYTQQIVKYALKDFKVTKIDDVKGIKDSSTVTGGNDKVANPFNLAVTIEMTFDKDIVSGHLTQMDDFNQTFRSLSIPLDKGTIKGSKIIIKSNLGDLDPNFGLYGTAAPVTKQQGKWGFWDSPVFVALKNLKKDGASSSSNNFWKGASFTFTGEMVLHQGKKVDAQIKTKFRLSSTLYTTLPDSVIANTVNEFRWKNEACCVDYFFFFIKQNKKDNKWYYFDETGKGITPATSDKDSYINGTRYITVDKNGKLVGNPPTLTVSQLKNRSYSAYCSVYTATKTVSGEQAATPLFNAKPTYVRFAIARYTYKNGQYVGTWLPANNKKVADKILSAREIIGAS